MMILGRFGPEPAGPYDSKLREETQPRARQVTECPCYARNTFGHLHLSLQKKPVPPKFISFTHMYSNDMALALPL